MVLAQKEKYRNPGSYGQPTTKEARLYNGEKTVSSVTGAGETGQLHVKE